MRLWPSVTLGALALALAAPVGSTARVPTRLQVVEQEYRLTLSRLSVRSGPAIVNVVNFGQDGHDLILVRQVQGAKPARTRVVPPRGGAELDVRLVPGRYDLYCSLPGHRAAGMRATLVVRR
jgi:plastocyanin